MDLLDAFLSVGHIDMYSKCGLIAINAMISGYLQNAADREGLMLFVEMYTKGMGFDQTTLLAILKCAAGMQAVNTCKQVHTLSVKSGLQSDAFVTNCLIDSYGKYCQMDDAARIFEECTTINLPSFTSIISAYAQCGQGEEALKFY
ncbi:hypothetical protein ACH5RR_016585, partial [Cinchona calisaya]